MIRSFLLALLLLCSGAAAARDLRVMSFNVRYATASDGPNDWPHRRALMVEVIAREKPDVIGTQELLANQAADLVAALPDYAWFGRDRRGGHSDEHMGVFYRRDRLRLVAQDDFWLSDTPSVPGSISWGHPLPRMAVRAQFVTTDGKGFTLFNTHLPYRREDEEARTRGARLIAQRIAAMPGPVVLTGDFNTDPASPAHALLTRELADAWTAAPRRSGPAATFHGFTGKPDRRIDWILTRGLRVTDVRTLDDHRSALYPSDHFPVVADFAWPR